MTKQYPSTSWKQFYIHYFQPYQITLALVVILTFSVITKTYHLSYPDSYVFDEVYVRFTAEQIAANNPKTWVWDYTAPKGFAYGWSHPKLGKQIMALAILIFGPHATSARLVSVIAGTLIAWVTYLLAKTLFPHKPWLGVLAAACIALDGLVFVLSRVGLADTQLTLYLLTSLYFLLNRKYFWSALFWGLAISVKWTGVYAVVFFGLYGLSMQLWQKNLLQLGKNVLSIAGMGLYYVGVFPPLYILYQWLYRYFYTQPPMSTPEFYWSWLRDWPSVALAFGLWMLIGLGVQRLYYPQWTLLKRLAWAGRFGLYFMGLGPMIYLLSYSLFFIYGFGVDKFIELQNQMYWYHTNLVATHPWQSPAISWPLDWRPVWFWVDYQPTTTANIYAMGNPLIFWVGVIAVFFTWGYAWISKRRPLFYLLLAYLTFWVPWIGSPRIMFLYHYLPAVPYLCIILAFMLTSISQHPKTKWIPWVFIVLCFGLFWYFYPHWTGIPIPKDQVEWRYQWLESWKP